jgi:O-antigen/teichoic acid export membrane protein
MGIQAISSLKAIIPPKGGFVFSVLTLVSGTSLAQGVVIAATPILTRLYKPEDFGVLALFLSVTGTLAVVANWRYELAIVLPGDDRDGINVLALAALIPLSMSGLCFLVVAFWRNDIAHLMNAPKLAPWLWWAPLSLLLSGVFEALIYWSTRKKQFAQQAVARVSKSVGTIGTQIGAGLWAPAGGGGLIAGALAGQLLGTGLLGQRVWRQQKQLMADSLTPASIREQAIRYRKFPFLTTLGGMVNHIAYQIPIWLLALYYSSQVVGFYQLAFQATCLPSSLVGASVSQVFLERATREKKQTGSSIETFKKTLLLLALLSFPPFTILMICGPALFSLVFGEAWTQAGQFAAILAPLFAIGFIASPLSLVCIIHEKQEIGLIWQIGLATLSAIVLFGGQKFFTCTNDVLKAFSCVLMAWYILLIVVVYKISKGK